MINQCPI